MTRWAHPQVASAITGQLRHPSHLAGWDDGVPSLDQQHRCLHLLPLRPVVPGSPLSRDLNPLLRPAMQPPPGLGAVEGLQEVPAGDGPELRENPVSRIEFLRQCVQPGLPRPNSSTNEVRRHILDHQRAHHVGSRRSHAPGVQCAHGVADQHGGPPEGVDGRCEFGNEPLCADGFGIVDISAAVPGRVVGVDRAKQGQPRQLTRPRAAATHQPMDKDQRPAGTAAIVQLGTHPPILARPCPLVGAVTLAP